jgi:hypothetical protein
MTSIHVEVTGEQIARAGDDRMAWAAPVEDAIAALTGVGVEIDGDGDKGNIATIGTREDATLVVDLPPEANAWLDRRWDGDRDDRLLGSEPIAFAIELPDWLIDLAADDAWMTLREAAALLYVTPANLRQLANRERNDGERSPTAARLKPTRVGRDWLVRRAAVEAEIAFRAKP